MKGRKPELLADGTVDSVPKAPNWLSPAAKAEWKRILPDLVKRRILTDADLGSVENYCLAIGRVRDLERQIQALGVDIDPAIIRLQDKAMQTSRQLAAELGLTPVSRSRPAMRDDGQDDELAGLDL